MNFLILIIVIIVALVPWKLNHYIFEKKRKQRRDYYRDVYLQSDAWKRKRFVVMRRDNWRCVYYGRPATQVHHKKYARNIGNEPIKWLVSVCHTCHESIHL
jgi:hypothetical protein